jgi:nucleoside-diphosphate-sugar epimerase
LQRILVTGGAGFIGTHLINNLSPDSDVFVVDNLTNEKSRSNAENFPGKHITLYQEDIRTKRSLHPISPYGASKLAAEQIVYAYGDLNLFESIITLRFFNVYGVGQNIEYAGVITKFRDRIVKNLSPIIFGDGNQQRDFIAVDDVVNSLIIASDPPSGLAKGIFNIGTGVPTKISDLARVMSILMGKPGLVPIYKEKVDGDIHLSYADISKAANILKFCARGQLSGGLQAFLSSS